MGKRLRAAKIIKQIALGQWDGFKKFVSKMNDMELNRELSRINEEYTRTPKLMVVQERIEKSALTMQVYTILMDEWLKRHGKETSDD